MATDIYRKILLVEDDVYINFTNSYIDKCASVEELIDYVATNYKNYDLFDIYLPGQHVDQFLQSNLWQFQQVKRVTCYFDSMDNMSNAQKRIKEPLKFQYCLNTEVENRIRNNICLKCAEMLEATRPFNAQCDQSTHERRAEPVPCSIRSIELD